MFNVSNTASARIARFGSGATILRSNNSPLSESQLRQAAPSIFAEEKHESRSARFQHIPTFEILRRLDEQGFRPYEVRQGGSRDTDKRNFTKHLIRFRKDGDRMLGDSFREVVLLNAHDGTSSYQMFGGVFRMVCSNGLLVADGECQMIRVPHKGDIAQNVIDAAYTIVDDGARIERTLSDMRQIELHRDEQELFAHAAAELRWTPDENGTSTVPIDTARLNRPRRSEDNSPDLWRTLNRVQENLTQGGTHYVTRDSRGNRRNGTTRPVNGIDGNVNLNRALWVLAEGMRKLKAGEDVAA
jgi:hypothetical protein